MLTKWIASWHSTFDISSIIWSNLSLSPSLAIQITVYFIPEHLVWRSSLHNQMSLLPLLVVNHSYCYHILQLLMVLNCLHIYVGISLKLISYWFSITHSVAHKVMHYFYSHFVRVCLGTVKSWLSWKSTTVHSLMRHLYERLLSYESMEFVSLISAPSKLSYDTCPSTDTTIGYVL